MRVRSLLLVAVLAVSAAACDQVLDEASLERTLTEQVEDHLEEDDLTVDCPDDVAVEEGGVFTCDASSAGGAVGTLEVTQIDDRGGVRWRIVDASAAPTDGAGPTGTGETDEAATGD